MFSRVQHNNNRINTRLLSVAWCVLSHSLWTSSLLVPRMDIRVPSPHWERRRFLYSFPLFGINVSKKYSVLDENSCFSFTQDHIQEVLDKWHQIDDEIWAKLIVMERNRRVAKAYARAIPIQINGSDDGFDGFRWVLFLFFSYREKNGLRERRKLKVVPIKPPSLSSSSPCS